MEGSRGIMGAGPGWGVGAGRGGGAGGGGEWGRMCFVFIKFKNGLV